MNQSEFSYEYDATRVQDVQLQIGARHTPSTDNPESWAVILFFQLPDGTRVEVAKIDNSEHDEGTIHIDQYYREIGAEVKHFGLNVNDCWEAENHLSERALRFGQTYLQNHGKKPREDKINS